MMQIKDSIVSMFFKGNNIKGITESMLSRIPSNRGESLTSRKERVREVVEQTLVDCYKTGEFNEPTKANKIQLQSEVMR